MFFDILTLFPRMFEGILCESILHRAIERGCISVITDDIRNYTTDKHNTVDDYPYGGDPGMVMKPEPVVAAIKAAKMRHTGSSCPVISLSPHGAVLDHSLVTELSKQDGLILLSGHYKGIDQRVTDLYVDQEISLGDFVLSGGEIPAMALIDSVSRLIPGVLGNCNSAQCDSHFDLLLSAPCYTRPEVFEGRAVPPILLSGNHGKISTWYQETAEQITRERRPDLWLKYVNKHTK